MRRLQFKFPNQIRIFGWDFGSSARAMNQAGGKDSLMTYESVPTAQADLGKVSRSTTERKSMSTKTSIKRIALVAVSALGLGVLTSVAPASATEVDDSASAGLTAIQLAPTAGGTAVSQNQSLVWRSAVATGGITLGIDVTGTQTTDYTATLKAVFSSKPAASLLTGPTFTAGTLADNSGSSGGTATASAASGTAAAKLILAPGTGNKLVDDANVGSIGFTPDAPGTYVIKIWHDTNANEFIDSTETARTLTVYVGGTPASFTATQYGATASTTPASGFGTLTNGGLLAIQFKDSAGNLTVLGSGEGFTMTQDNSGLINGGNSSGLTVTSSTTPSGMGYYSYNITKVAAGVSNVVKAR